MGNITKKDLVERISETTGLTQVDTKIVLESFLEAVASSLQSGRNIEIRGFGRFKIKERKARMARNPRTDEQVKIEAGYKPVFEASRELRKRVNESYLQTHEERGSGRIDLPRQSAADLREPSAWRGRPISNFGG
ncbi:MAG: integration host factor subunit beta [Chitinivibrionales bacterium]|nr:integration host factor subunit beta [Chitinivibrionales bacterium]MBD3358884.1 integration host factor subunit beta [Chitinivibrionales bacterium]